MYRMLTLLAAAGLLQHLSAQSISYTDVTSSMLIQHDYGYTLMQGQSFDIGGGVAFCDYDLDGRDDLCFSSDRGQGLFVYHNDGATFSNATPTLLQGDTMESKHTLWADYDNDGDRDLLVTNFLGPLRFYRNDNGTLVDITATCGLTLDTMPTFGGTFGDYDLDGDLDLYISNYNVSATGTNILYNNDGNGNFTDVTAAAGVADSGKASFQATFFDYDNDGLPDMYVANDRFGPNTLYRNLGNGTFQDVSQSSAADLMMWSMCVAIGDFDNNGCMDIYVTNVLAGNRLLVNQCNGTFVERAQSLNLEMHKVCWGAQFFDADNDGDLDLYACASEDSAQQWTPNSFFENQGNGQFQERFGIGLGDSRSSVGMSVGDHNDDGFWDIAVSNGFTSWSQLYEATPNTNHWLKVTPHGVQSNRDGIGVTYEVVNTNMNYLRYTTCGTSYSSQNSFSEILGLGTATTLNQLIVTWPLGTVDTLKAIPADQHIDITEGQGNILANATLNNACGGTNNGMIALAPTGGNGAFTYKWSTGDTSGTILNLAPGSYSVTITSNYSCRVYSFNIGQFAAPTPPTLTQSGDTLFSSSASSYQWFLNGSAISGAIMQSHVALVNGQYHVQITDANGCLANSDTLSILLNTATRPQESFTVHQDPTRGAYTVHLPALSSGTLMLRIYSCTGTLLKSQKWQADGRSQVRQLHLQDLASGVYLLDVRGENVHFRRKIVRF